MGLPEKVTLAERFVPERLVREAVSFRAQLNELSARMGEIADQLEDTLSAPNGPHNPDERSRRQA